MPYSKHIHILGALPNIFFRNLGQRGVMPKLNLEDENDWGVGKIEGFTRKSLMDQYACTECARCSNYCPAFNTEKPLSPMHLIHDLRDEMIERGSLQQKIKKIEAQIAQQGANGASSPGAHGIGDAERSADGSGRERAQQDRVGGCVGQPARRHARRRPRRRTKSCRRW